MNPRLNSARVFLLVLTAVALCFSYLIFRPYLAPIAFAIIIAIVFHPLHRRIRQRLSGPNYSAFLSTAAALLVTIVPLVLLGLAVSNELSGLYNSLSAKTGEGGLLSYFLHGLDRANAWISGHFPMLPRLDLRDVLLRRVAGAGSGLVGLGAGLVGNVFTFVVDAVIAFFVLFFLFRDGKAGLAYLSDLLPLSGQRTQDLWDRISSTLVANIYGGLAVGSVQGVLTAIAFWALGLGSPILWGLVTAVFSFVPMVGSAAVWVPAGAALLFTGHVVKGIVLLGWGAGVISLSDNFVRPWVISGRTSLPAVYVLLSLLGGVQAFGVLGLFVGPVILSVTAALLQMLREDRGREATQV
ncbi:MAG TPA: AI-2E family transporter [Terriglobales bacterium]|nr:AI-2E family transporter [Terriglobales bacterium]